MGTEREGDGLMRGMACVTALAMALTLGACGGGAKGSQEPQRAEQKADQKDEHKAEAQTFESDVASVEYRDTQDVAGNAMVSFALTNNTGSTVMVSSEGLLLNDEYSIESLGGAATPIQSGKTGSVSLVFGVSAQTSLSGTDDIETLSGELVLVDDKTYERLGTVPFSVRVK